MPRHIHDCLWYVRSENCVKEIGRITCGKKLERVIPSYEIKYPCIIAIDHTTDRTCLLVKAVLTDTTLEHCLRVVREES